MWELDHKEVRAPKNWCFQTVVRNKTFESPVDSTEIEPVNPKGNQHWIFFGRTDAEAPILWLPDVKSWLTGKDYDAGKDWEPAEKGAIEDEMAGWHHWRNGQTQGDGEGQRSLECCGSWGHKESDMTQQLSNTTAGGSVARNPPADAVDMGLIPDLGGAHVPRDNQAHTQLLSLCSGA